VIFFTGQSKDTTMLNRNCKTHWFKPLYAWIEQTPKPDKRYLIVVSYVCIVCAEEKYEELMDCTNMSYAQQDIVFRQCEQEGFEDIRPPF
jgi:hypothetical protein